MAVTGGCDLNDAWAIPDEDKKELEGLEGDAYKQKLRDLQLNQWRNKAVADTYEPGSIFKLITASSALEEGVVDLNWSYTCTGSIKVSGWPHPISCWKKSGHGTETFTRALQNSCNPAFVTIGLKLGQEKFYEYLKAYGFGRPTNIDLPGEAAGLLHDYKAFLSNDVSLAVSSFGQTFTVTPIQMITAVSAIVNGGYLMKPHVVKEYVASDGTVEKTVEPEIVRQVIVRRDFGDDALPDGAGRRGWQRTQCAGQGILDRRKDGDFREDHRQRYVR